MSSYGKTGGTAVPQSSFWTPVTSEITNFGTSCHTSFWIETAISSNASQYNRPQSFIIAIASTFETTKPDCIKLSLINYGEK